MTDIYLHIVARTRTPATAGRHALQREEDRPSGAGGQPRGGVAGEVPRDGGGGRQKRAVGVGTQRQGVAAAAAEGGDTRRGHEER